MAEPEKEKGMSFQMAVALRIVGMFAMIGIALAVIAFNK